MTGKPIRSTLPIVRQLFEHLKKHHITLVAVAEASGVDASTMSEWRQGHAVPRFDLFIAVCNAVGKEVELK